MQNEANLADVSKNGRGQPRRSSHRGSIVRNEPNFPPYRLGPARTSRGGGQVPPHTEEVGRGWPTDLLLPGQALRRTASGTGIKRAKRSQFATLQEVHHGDTEITETDLKPMTKMALAPFSAYSRVSVVGIRAKQSQFAQGRQEAQVLHKKGVRMN